MTGRMKLYAQQAEIEESFRRLRTLETRLGIPGRGPRPDDPERESNRHMRKRLLGFSAEIRERLAVVEGLSTPGIWRP